MLGIETTLDDVPGIRLRRQAPLARFTTFRIGGAADLLAEVGTQRALRRMMAAAHRGATPVLLLGLGSNVLLPDDGLRGLVVRLTGGFRRVRVVGSRVYAGGATPLGRLARQTAERGLGGLEALSGFPSTVGGAVVMNAGCYGAEIADVLTRVTLIDRQGRLERRAAADLEPAYRSTRLQGTGHIVALATFDLRPGPREPLVERIAELNRRRWGSLPSGHGHAGSIFRNPPDDHAGRLIEAAGLKGTKVGGAQISPKHANVIVNLGEATAADVLELMLRARDEVDARFGVTLEPEIVLTGGLAEAWRRGRSLMPVAGAGA